MKSQFILSVLAAVGLTLSGCGGGGGTTPTPSTPSFSLSTATVTEGNASAVTIDFTVTLSETLTGAVTVDYYTSDGTATAGVDYTAIPATTVVIPAGSTTATVSVTVAGDTMFEVDETMNLHVSSSSHPNLGAAVETGTIINDDTVPTVSIAAASVAEGNAGTTNLALTVTLSALSGVDTTVDYVTANGTALAGSDYNVITAATLTIPAGSTTGTVNIAVFADTTFETNETMMVTLSNPANATLATATATGTITNDDTVPTVSIAAASVGEGNAGTTNLDFTVTLSAASSQSISVNYTTADATALAGSDYTAITTTTLNIPAGSTTGTISVIVAGDTLFETDETLNVTLSNPGNATISTALAVGTITNDDTAPSLSIAGSSVVEGNAGTANMTFTITLSAVSGVNTTVDLATSDSTALAGSDYTAASNTLNIPAGLTTRTVTVLVSGDTTFESDETLIATMSNPSNATIATATATGTITNDDTAPSVSIAGASIAEGNAGTTNLVFTVTLNAVSGTNADVDYATSNGTATAGSDYTAATATLSIPAGSSTGTITVVVSGDTLLEADETMTVTLSNPINTTLGTATATGTITNDDATPVAMTISGKSLDFTWGVDSFTGITQANIDHYRILVNPDGVSGFTVVPTASNIAILSHSIEIPVHKTNWTSAQYLVEACNLAETTCGTSANQTLALIDSIAATVYVKASNTGAGDKFAWSVAISGDGNTLAVGANGERSAATGIGGNQADDSALVAGAVYVFTKTGSTWAQQAYVKASNAQFNDRFGSSVSLSNDGNTLAVGVNFEDSVATGVGGNQADNTADGSGAVYVFVRSAIIGWSQQAYIKASNTGAGDEFGYAVSLSSDGNTLAVSAIGEDSSATGIGGNQSNFAAGTDSGAVYLFGRTGVVWSQQAYVKASNTNAADQFGYNISLSGNGSTLAVGAYFEDSAATGIGGNQADNTATNSGAVYVFINNGVSWVQQAYIKASNNEIYEKFAWAVSLSSDGNTLAVGATGEDGAATGIGGNQADNTASAAGAVYVFVRAGGTGWSQQAYVKASNTEAADEFGSSISLSGDGNTLAVGAIAEDSSATGINGSQASNAAGASGAVYLFTRTGLIWSQKSYVKASNTDASDSFGSVVSLSADGNALAVGANKERSAATGIGGNQTGNTIFDAGAVYLY